MLSCVFLCVRTCLISSLVLHVQSHVNHTGHMCHRMYRRGKAANNGRLAPHELSAGHVGCACGRTQCPDDAPLHSQCLPTRVRVNAMPEHQYPLRWVPLGRCNSPRCSMRVHTGPQPGTGGETTAAHARMLSMHTCVHMQEQQASLDLFRSLRMSQEQQEAAADAWRVWTLTRATLDRHLAAALQPLSALLDRSDLILGAGMPHSAHSVRSIHSSRWDTPPQPGKARTLPPLRMDGDAATRAREPWGEDLGMAVGVVGGGVADRGAVCANRICLCVECAAKLAGRLPGVTGGSTDSAQRALRALVAVHAHDADACVEQLRAICKPGVIFTTEQCALQTELMLQRGVFTDWVSLCKTAAAEADQAAVTAHLQRVCGVI